MLEPKNFILAFNLNYLKKKCLKICLSRFMTIIGIKTSKKRRVVLPLMSKVKLEVPIRSRFQISKTDVTVTKKDKK